MAANVLSIAGVDPSGGAGLLADLKTFTALGTFGCGVVTALTAQNTCGVAAVEVPPVPFLRAQLTTLFADVPIAAAKTGMLANAAVIETVAEGIAAENTSRKAPLPLVLDPVMIATSGDVLLDAEAVATLIDVLFPFATVLTPNLLEAAALTGAPLPTSFSEMVALAKRLRALLPAGEGRWVFLKGGHLPEAEPLIDLAFDGTTLLTFPVATRVEGLLHGTGCTLAAAIAAEIGRWAVTTPAGAPLTPAVAEPLFAAAHRYVQGAVVAAEHLTAGHGARPLFHAYHCAYNS